MLKWEFFSGFKTRGEEKENQAGIARLKAELKNLARLEYAVGGWKNHFFTAASDWLFVQQTDDFGLRMGKNKVIVMFSLILPFAS